MHDLKTYRKSQELKEEYLADGLLRTSWNREEGEELIAFLNRITCWSSIKAPKVRGSAREMACASLIVSMPKISIHRSRGSEPKMVLMMDWLSIREREV
jgi:hypothetical protein